MHAAPPLLLSASFTFLIRRAVLDAGLGLSKYRAKPQRGVRHSPTLGLRGFVRKICKRFAGALGRTVEITLVGESLTPHSQHFHTTKKGTQRCAPFPLPTTPLAFR